MITQKLLSNGVSLKYAKPSYVTSWEETPSGRCIGRHSNNEGCVIAYDNYGTTKHLFVADAKYRQHYGEIYFQNFNSLTSISLNSNSDYPTNDNFGPYLYNANIADIYKNDDTIQNEYGHFIYRTVSKGIVQPSEYPILNPLTDLQLQSILGQGPKTDGTAKNNTTKLLGSYGTSDVRKATSVVRKITSISEMSSGLDIPTIYQLCVIAIESENIDTLDISLTDYAHYKLGYGYKTWTGKSGASVQERQRIYGRFSLVTSDTDETNVTRGSNSNWKAFWSSSKKSGTGSSTGSNLIWQLTSGFYPYARDVYISSSYTYTAAVIPVYELD